jgi:Family of unknown function (DUF5681)
MPFEPGQSGNPAGRPRGARNRRTVLIENLFESEVEAVARQAIERAKAGDIAAIRLIVDRLAPKGREQPVDFELPPITSFRDSAAALEAVTQAVASGDLTPGEAASLCKLIESRLCALAHVDLEERIASLESQCSGA